MAKQISAYIDFNSNWMNLPGEAGERSREQYINHLKEQIDVERDRIISRYCSLPPLVVHDGPHVPLLKEARELFIHGSFYACVAMCGITSERIVHDLVAAIILIRRKDVAVIPPPKALKQFDQVTTFALWHFLLHCAAISQDVLNTFQNLGKLRNVYAHGGGNPSEAQADASRAVTWLHAIIEETVSVFRDHDLVNGQLVPKKDSPAPEE